MTEDATGENRLGNKITTTLREAHHLTSAGPGRPLPDATCAVIEEPRGRGGACLARAAHQDHARAGRAAGHAHGRRREPGPRLHRRRSRWREVERVKSLGDHVRRRPELLQPGRRARPSRHMDPFVITVDARGETDHELVGHEGEEWLYGMEGCDRDRVRQGGLRAASRREHLLRLHRAAPGARPRTARTPSSSPSSIPRSEGRRR